MRLVTIKNLCVCLLLIYSNLLMAQTTNSFDFERIKDNSFLLEEAYNQEKGIIQHVSSFQYMNDKYWTYTFTEKWPLKSQKHQISVTIPVFRYYYTTMFNFDKTVYDKTGLGDMSLNYRYQAILTERFAFSPRLSLIIPTGNYKKGFGNGVIGYQANMPFSFICSRWLVTHYNIGLTYTPNEKDGPDNNTDVTNINYGSSAVFLLSRNFNLMFEVACNDTFYKTDTFGTIKDNSLLLNPGFRFAINFKSGLQIVPGLAMPIGIGPSEGTYGVFAYLSFEHLLRK
jgi:hypothetical protein